VAVENEKWVPTPEQLKMIEDAVREKENGYVYWEAEARAEIERRVKLLIKTNGEQSARLNCLPPQ